MSGGLAKRQLLHFSAICSGLPTLSSSLGPRRLLCETAERRRALLVRVTGRDVHESGRRASNSTRRRGRACCSSVCRRRRRRLLPVTPADSAAHVPQPCASASSAAAMQVGEKGVKYGLQLRVPPGSKPAAAKRAPPARKPSVFGDEDSDEERADGVEAQIARQAARKQSDKKVRALRGGRVGGQHRCTSTRRQPMSTLLLPRPACGPQARPPCVFNRRAALCAAGGGPARGGAGGGRRHL